MSKKIDFVEVEADNNEKTRYKGRKKNREQKRRYYIIEDLEGNWAYLETNKEENRIINEIGTGMNQTESLIELDQKLRAENIFTEFYEPKKREEYRDNETAIIRAELEDMKYMITIHYLGNDKWRIITKYEDSTELETREFVEEEFATIREQIEKNMASAEDALLDLFLN